MDRYVTKPITGTLALPAARAARPIRVLIADDHPVVCEGISTILKRAGDIDVVAAVQHGVSVLTTWTDARPDVAIIDLRMPGLDGAQVTTELRRRRPGARVIIMTAFIYDDSLRRCVAAGANSVISKDATAECMINTVRRVHGGEFVLGPDLDHRLAAHGRRPALTSRERQILHLLRTGLSNQEMADRLYLSVHTVKSHLKNLFDKLGVLSRTEAVRIALERGLVEVS